MSRPATNRLKCNPPLGRMPVLMHCAPGELQVDAAYQRSTEGEGSQSLIRRLAMFWNWDLCLPLVVSRRRTDADEALFGFTAYPPTSEIGRAVALLAADFGWTRAAIRFSGAPHEARASRVIGPGEVDADAILCPAQTGATACCGSCGLCWQSDRSIAFRRH